MVEYLQNALQHDRVAGWKSGLGRLRMFFDAAPSVQSKKKADGADCDEKTWEEDMKERVGGWWW